MRIVRRRTGLSMMQGRTESSRLASTLKPQASAMLTGSPKSRPTRLPASSPTTVKLRPHLNPTSVSSRRRLRRLPSQPIVQVRCRWHATRQTQCLSIASCQCPTVSTPDRARHLRPSTRATIVSTSPTTAPLLNNNNLHNTHTLPRANRTKITNQTIINDGTTAVAIEKRQI